MIVLYDTIILSMQQNKTNYKKNRGERDGQHVTIDSFHTMAHHKLNEKEKSKRTKN